MRKDNEKISKVYLVGDEICNVFMFIDVASLKPRLVFCLVKCSLSVHFYSALYFISLEIYNNKKSYFGKWTF